MRKNYFLGLLFGGIFCVFSVTSCRKVATPKPYGYYRITLPDTSYVDFETLYPDYPYTFDLSQNAVVQPRNDEPYWINVYYPALDATIHCSYKSVHRNLRELSDDALEFVYRNASFANAIPEREYAHLLSTVSTPKKAAWSGIVPVTEDLSLYLILNLIMY